MTRAFPGGPCSVAREGLEARKSARGGHQDQADQGVEPQRPARWWVGEGGRVGPSWVWGWGDTDCEGARNTSLHLDQAVLLGLTSRFEGAGVCASLWGPFSPFNPRTEDSRREGPHLAWEASDGFRVPKTLGKGKGGPRPFCGLVTSSTSSTNLSGLK